MTKPFKIKCVAWKIVNDGRFYRFWVLDESDNQKADFWFTETDSGDIYTVASNFTDERYSWIHLYVSVESNAKNGRFYPDGAYMETSSLKMTSDECRDIIRCFEEASEVCDFITNFFKHQFH